MPTGEDRQKNGCSWRPRGRGVGSDGTVSGFFFIFRFKFIAFKALLMGFISRSLSLKIRPLAGTSWTGTKDWYCPRKIRTLVLGRPGINPGLYTNRFSNSFVYFYSCEIILSNFLTESSINDVMPDGGRRGFGSA